MKTASTDRDVPATPSRESIVTGHALHADETPPRKRRKLGAAPEDAAQEVATGRALDGRP
jgi:hypothetical protein